MMRSRVSAFIWFILGSALIIVGTLCFGQFILSFPELLSRFRLLYLNDHPIAGDDFWRNYLIGEMFGSFVLGVIGPLFIRSGYSLIRRGRKHLVYVYASTSLLDNTGAPEVLYVRSFESDYALYGHSLGLSTEEEQLIKALRVIGTTVTVGRPGEDLPQIGARRVYFRDDEWQDRVIELIRSVKLILILPGLDDGLRWEVEQILWWAPPERVLLVVHNEDTLLAFRSWTDHRISWSKTKLPFIKFRNSSIRGFIRFDEKWNPICIPIEQYTFLLGTDFEFLALRVALRAVLRWHSPRRMR